MLLLARAGPAGPHGLTLVSSHSYISEQGSSRPEGSESAARVAKPMWTLVGEDLSLAVSGEEEKNGYCTGMQYSVSS